jgi:uncharacterized protein (TIGR03067 family)
MVPTRLKSAALPLLTLAAVGLALAGSPAGQPRGKGKGKSDQDLFQGRWSVVALEKGGVEVPKELTKEAAAVIKGNKITIELLGETKEVVFKLDPTKKPKAIDLKFEGKDFEGIYELNGETLRVCVPTEAGTKRPKEFQSEGDMLLATFKRSKGAKGADKDKGGEKGGKDATGAPEQTAQVWASYTSLVDYGGKPAGGLTEKPPERPARPAKGTAEQRRLGGTWEVVSAEKGGAPVPEDITRQVKITLTGDALTFAIGEDAKTGTYRVDSTRQPRTIDFTLNGKTAQGIYELDKGNLKICFAEPGLPRPKGFKSENDRELLAVLKRTQGGAVKEEKETLEEEAARLRREVTELRQQVEEARRREREARAALEDALQARPAPRAARAAQGAQQTGSANNLKQIGLAMHNYHDARRSLPAAAIYSKDGKPLLSWRVAILPYLDQRNLYNQFKLDEPWDSPHNKKLIDKMPRIYAPIGVDLKPGTTMYRVFVGPGAAFEGTSGQRFPSFTDGTSNTILVVEAGEAVPWTKPDELRFDPKGKLPKLGGHFKGGFNVLVADGSTRAIRANFDPQLLRAAITRNGGEVIDFDKLAQ